MNKYYLITILAYLTSTFQISAQIQWKNPMDETYPILRGQAWQNELKGTYFRLPDRAEKTVRPLYGNYPDKQQAYLSYSVAMPRKSKFVIPLVEDLTCPICLLPVFRA